MMPRILLIAITLGGAGLANAQSGALSPADREALLERLEQLRNASDSRIDARFRQAIAAYRSAMTSEEATFAFYMKCVEKVDFEDQNRRAQDFREWRRRNDERLKDQAFRRALRHQLRWLVLTLQAASSDADRAELASSAQEIVDTIFRDASAFGGHQNILRQPVTGSVFARAYEIGNLRIENWVLAPGNVGEVYDRILLPPQRRARNPESLRNGWIKRIQQEITAAEEWQDDGNERRGRIGMASALRGGPEYERFMAEEVPKLQWQMELDVFRHGDPSGAALRMLAHLERHVTHASARDWTTELEGLLRAESTAAQAD